MVFAGSTSLKNACFRQKWTGDSRGGTFFLCGAGLGFPVSRSLAFQRGSFFLFLIRLPNIIYFSTGNADGFGTALLRNTE